MFLQRPLVPRFTSVRSPRTALCAWIVGLASTASAQSINMDFGPAAPYGKPQLTYGGAAFQTGQWNQVTGNAGPYGGALGGVIVDTTGLATPVQVRLTAGADGFCDATAGCVGAGPLGSDDEVLMDDFSRFANASDLFIQGLDAGFYSIYVYAWAPDNALAITTVDGVNVGGPWPNQQLSGTTYTTKSMVPVAANVPVRIRLRGATGTLNAVQIVRFGPLVGTTYCQPNTNTSGYAARMTSFGSIVATDNELYIAATGMPVNVFGFFVTSMTQAFIPNPGGSQGNLCLGGQIGRGVGGQIINSGPDGMIMTPANLMSHPTPSGPVAVMAGQTWNIQCWFRDRVGGSQTSNYSDALSVTFL